jgi:phenylalanyl-tRNA synthetase alpha subunit
VNAQSGMFRTEFVQVAGIPEGVRVLGFGLSLERPFLLRSVHFPYIHNIC